MEPYHSRQVVVLQPQDWAAWIYLTRPEKELLRPLPGGSLDVETVRKEMTNSHPDELRTPNAVLMRLVAASSQA